MAVSKRWLLATTILLIIGYCMSCVEGPPPERDFDAEDLLLDAAAFPQGWQAGEVGDLPGPIAGQAHEYERVTRGFTGPGLSRIGNWTRAGQRVYRYGGTRTAAKKFEAKRKQYFKSDAFTPEWKIPDELTYRSSVADKFHLGCTYYSTAWECRALGQYEEYVVLILVDVYPDSDVTYADFERILQAMEERITSYLAAQ
jgi:hypothetical protein